MLAGLGFLVPAHAYAMSPVERILIKEVIGKNPQVSHQEPAEIFGISESDAKW